MSKDEKLTKEELALLDPQQYGKPKADWEKAQSPTPEEQAAHDAAFAKKSRIELGIKN